MASSKFDVFRLQATASTMSSVHFDKVVEVSTRLYLTLHGVRQWYLYPGRNLDLGLDLDK